MRVRLSGTAICLAAIVCLGCALRIAAARGGLWLDEAWSALYAHEVGTAGGVFLNINHDNNHHLNTLWLQLVGIGAPSLLQRTLSIATGTAGIVLAGCILAPIGRRAMLFGALLFAVSPALVIFGSEARGYAPMIFFLLLSVWLETRWVRNPAMPRPDLALAVSAALGMLSHLSMLVGIAALSLALLPPLLKQQPTHTALSSWFRLLVPSWIAAAIVVVMVFGAAKGHFQFGAHAAYQFAALEIGLSGALAWSFGWATMPQWIAPAIIICVLLLGPPSLRLFAGLLLLGYPLAIAVLHVGNSGIPRYYLLSGVAALLMFGAAAERHGSSLWFSAAVLAFLIGSLTTDFSLIRNLRGDASAALVMLASRAPAGAVVAIDRSRSEAILEVLANQYRYRLRIAQPCSARFWFVERDGSEPFPAPPILCGRSMTAIAGARTYGLSGTNWKLYEVGPTR